MPGTDLDELLGGHVTPVLRAAGWRRRGLRYHRSEPNGDHAEVHFGRRGERSWSAGCAVSPDPLRRFLLAFRGVENPRERAPAWTRPWNEQLADGRPESLWNVTDNSDPAAIARQVRADLTDSIVPQLTALLDRRVFVDVLRVPPRPFSRPGGGLALDARVAEAVLLAEDGPSRRLTELLDGMWAGHDLERFALHWVAERAGTAAPGGPAEEAPLFALLAGQVDAALLAQGAHRDELQYRSPSPIGGTRVTAVVPSTAPVADRVGFYVLTRREDVPGRARPTLWRAAPPPANRASPDVRSEVLGLPLWVSGTQDPTLAGDLIAIHTSAPEQ